MTSTATSSNVRIEEHKGMRVAYLRDHGNAAHVAAPLMRKVRQLASTTGIHGPHAQYVSFVNDDPSTGPHEQTRADAGVSVKANYKLPPFSELALREIPAGQYAVYRHVGPYKGLREAWTKFREQARPNSVHVEGPCAVEMARLAGDPTPTHVRRPLAPSFEVYVNDPSDTPEDQLITDLYQPIHSGS